MGSSTDPSPAARFPPTPGKYGCAKVADFGIAKSTESLAGDHTATNMLVTVVTYYTVSGDRLIPLEHVRVPAGWQQVILGSE